MKKLRSTLALMVFVSLTFVPLVLGLGYALLYSVGGIGLLSKGLTLSHWQQVLSSGEIGWTLIYSVYIALLTMLISVSLALLALLAGGRHWRRGALSYLVYFPLAMPAMVVAFFCFEFLSKSGFLSRLFYHTGVIQEIAQFPDLIQDSYAIGIIFAHVLMATPFLLILFLNIYQREQVNQLQALATSLGAQPRQVLRKVTLPILLQKALPTLLLYFIFVMGSYEIPLLLGQQSPQMFSVFVLRQLQGFDLQAIPRAYVIICLYALGVMGGIFVLLKRRAYDESI